MVQMKELAALPNELVALNRMILGLQNENHLLQVEVSLLKHLRFAAKSEKGMAEDNLQEFLFDGTESVPSDSRGEDHETSQLIEISYTRKKAGHKSLPENLP